MKRMASIFKAGIIVVVFKGFFAYLDPGSGSLIVQLLLAVIVAILATFRLWKAKLLALFGIKQEREDEEREDAA